MKTIVHLITSLMINGRIDTRIGRPKDYSKEEKNELYKLVQSVVKDEFEALDIPIVMNVDFGHTDPKIIMPLGCKVSINPKEKEIKLLESPFV